MRRLPVVLLLSLASVLSGATSARAAASVGFAVSSALTSNQRVTFSESVHNVTPENLVFRIWGQSSPLTARLTCRDGAGAVADCTTGNVRRVDVDPRLPLVAGEVYAIDVNPATASALILGAGGPVAAATRTFRASVSEQETSAGATYRWQSQSDPNALGDSYVRERVPMAQAGFWFTGTGVNWYTRRGPSEGLAAVYIDGKFRKTINNFASSYSIPVKLGFGGLTDARHSILIRVLGRPGATGGGTYVSIDGFRVNRSSTIHDATSYSWRRVSHSSASGDTYAYANQARESVTFRFRGAGIEWFTVTGPSQGIANVYIDGRLARSIDNYSPTVRFGVKRTIIGLADTQHTITIAVAYGKHPRSTGTGLSVDRFLLRASVASFKGLGAWVDLFDYGSGTTRAQIDAWTADLDARNVRTIYLQTARYNSSSAFNYPTQVGMWLDSAHERGIKVMGWYLPAYGGPCMDSDVARTVAIATFRSSTGQGFDALGIDVEVRNATLAECKIGQSAFMAGVTEHLARVRGRVGLVFPIGAITMTPLDMDRAPSYWSGFPWSSIGRYADVVMPMSYWTVSSDRSRCDGGDADYCPYGFTYGNATRTRAYTGLPVHIIGGVGNAFDEYKTVTGRSPLSQINDYVRAAGDAGAIGGGLYDYRTIRQDNASIVNQVWSAQQPLN
jgi:hypothetical protein